MTRTGWIRVESPLGWIRLAAGHGRLTGLHIEPDSPFLIDTGARQPDSSGADQLLLAEAARQLTEYLAGRRRAFELDLAPPGSRFQRQVWSEVLEIPFGATVTYGQLARRIGRPGAARAVGQANAHNPIPVIIPCHRVIGGDGDLTGYRGGLSHKRWLLDHEARVATITPPAAR